MLRLYNTALFPLRLATPLVAWWRCRDPARRTEWAERRAHLLPESRPHGVWIHGSSVGEALLVRALARGLRERNAALPLSVSAYTPTGRAGLPAPPGVDSAFVLPLDFPRLVARVLRAVDPAALVLVETELWPNLMHRAARLGVPVVIANGRLSERRMARYRRFDALYRPLLRRVRHVGAQSSDDARRFEALGVPAAQVAVTGNLKFDLPVPEESGREIRERLGIPLERPVFVAGSTGAGEEALVVEAFRNARRVRPELLLLLAPRHPERVDEVARAIGEADLGCLRRSELDTGLPPETDVLLVDTVGELAGLYALGTVSFVGGSLVPVGGHNLLEPAAAGSPVLFGPHVQNTAETARLLLRSGGGLQVAGAAELGATVGRLLGDDAARELLVRRARQVLDANRGALERTLDLIVEAVEAGRRAAAGGAP